MAGYLDSTYTWKSSNFVANRPLPSGFFRMVCSKYKFTGSIPTLSVYSAATPLSNELIVRYLVF